MHALIRGSTEDRDYLDDKIIEFNSKKVPFTQAEKFIYIDYVIKDKDIIVGGITAVLYCWNCLYINVLWVDEKYRHSGYGSELLEKVESEAIKQGCYLSHLDTFDFQAKDFYLKNGYEVFGVLDNCPPGHSRFYLRKVFMPQI